MNYEKKNQCERSVNKFKYDNGYESHTLLYIEKTAKTDHDAICSFDFKPLSSTPKQKCVPTYTVLLSKGTLSVWFMVTAI